MVIERIANENCYDRCFVVNDIRRTNSRERCETRAATPKRSSPISSSSDVEDHLVSPVESESDDGEGAKQGISGNQCTTCSSTSTHCLFKGDHLYLCSLYWQDHLLPCQGIIH